MDDQHSKLDQQLLNAYINTNYVVDIPRLNIRIGQKNWELSEFLIDNNIYSWAFISAWNPYSQVTDSQTNEKMHQTLCAEIKNKGLLFCEGHGISDNGAWEPEKSLFIMGITKEDAIQIAQSYRQNAIIFGSLDSLPELLICTKE